jgi:hypothetical protein
MLYIYTLDVKEFTNGTKRGKQVTLHTHPLINWIIDDKYLKIMFIQQAKKQTEHQRIIPWVSAYYHNKIFMPFFAFYWYCWKSPEYTFSVNGSIHRCLNLQMVYTVQITESVPITVTSGRASWQLPFKQWSVGRYCNFSESGLKVVGVGVGGCYRDLSRFRKTNLKAYASVAYHQMELKRICLSASFNIGWANKKNQQKTWNLDQFDGFLCVHDFHQCSVGQSSINYLDVQVGLCLLFLNNCMCQWRFQHNILTGQENLSSSSDATGFR